MRAAACRESYGRPTLWSKPEGAFSIRTGSHAPGLTPKCHTA
jgi:hypothetical protein